MQNQAISKPLQGILRRRSSGAGLGSPASSPTGSPNKEALRVHFQPPPDLADILRRRKNGGGAQEELEGFITHLRNQRGQALVAWVQILQENISLLTPDLERFVIETLKVHWATQDRPVAAAFSGFLANLVTAHSFYVRPVAFMLVSRLQSSEGQTAAHVHEAVKEVLRLSPLSSGVLLQYVAERMPYLLIKNTALHTMYIRNLTEMLGYLESAADRETLLKVVIERLVQLDAHLPKLLEDEDEDDEEDDDEESGEMFRMEEGSADASSVQAAKDDDPSDATIARRNLDAAMTVMFDYVESASSTPEGLRRLYPPMLSAFEAHVLPAYATGHVQFLLFRLLAVDEERGGGKARLAASFLDWLWSKFTDPNTAPILRQSCAAYVASLVARARFVGLPMAKVCLERLVQWVHGYISAREDQLHGRKRGVGGDYMYVDIRAHGAFYAACQSALYIFAFRHQEFVSSERLLAFLRGLNLSTVVTSRLNPLRVCLPSVVANFAAVARRYQLVYCDAVIQRNARINLPVVGGLSSGGSTSASSSAKPLLLDSFFPFDPYALKGSACRIEADYRVYQGAVIGDGDSSEEEDEEEDKEDKEEKGDEMDVQQHEDSDEEQEEDGEESLGSPAAPARKRRRLSSCSSNKANSVLSSLLYGTSPGFKC